MNIIIFILVLLIVVIVHEYGHFFAAKSMGMRVKEFAFGFPPKLFSWKRGETTYSLNAIPLGGYVAIDGENEGNGTNDNRKFGSKSRLAQLWVLFAGPMMNIILAFVLITASYIGINKVNGDAAKIPKPAKEPVDIKPITEFTREESQQSQQSQQSCQSQQLQQGAAVSAKG